MVERVASDGIEPLSIDVAALLEKLSGACAREPKPVFAFDGDGTLWSGDVGEDVFRRATRLGLLREESRAALLREAQRYAVETPDPSDANAVALRLFESYLSGGYPEREACAMMTWCYAGLELEEFTPFVRATFDEVGLRGRLHQELGPVLELARSHHAELLVVSASPQRIVEEAAALWGIPAQSVLASQPAVRDGRIQAQLARPVPYAEHKPLTLAERANLAHLVAAFGDNVFDIELLTAARVGVAVRPKAALRTRLRELTGVYVLRAPVESGSHSY
ncbi:MAG TPA: haloacid dehalogenase-like hydrolase [Polyangiaceae bacterium]|nr:haloacid dehalogenase-like hydrolase [Polyangiaceae bacterium]